MPALHPPVLWAQRKDVVYVTVDLQDVTGPKVKLDNVETDDGKGEKAKFGMLKFDGRVGQEEYGFELELAGEVKPEETKISATGRHVFVVVYKMEEGFWPMLQRQKGKLPWLKVDWNKWVDEDDEDSKDPFDLNAIDNLAGLEDMQGMGGDDDDDDEEELPDQDKANGSGTKDMDVAEEGKKADEVKAES